MAKTSLPATQAPLRALAAQATDILHKLLRDDCGAPLLQPTCASVARVRIQPLRLGRKVLRRGDTLWLDQEYVAQTLQPGDDESLAACVLYFLHELLHLSQGMAEKETIHQLRAAGGEETLLGVDLQADHTAAHLAAQAVSRWQPLWLKEVQARSLAAFPVNASHSPLARRRKSRRLAALRLEILGHQRGMLPLAGAQEGYLWPEFAPQGGPLLLLRSAPLQRVVYIVATITAAEAQALDNAADPQRGPDQAGLDAVCAQVLARGRRL